VNPPIVLNDLAFNTTTLIVITPVTMAKCRQYSGGIHGCAIISNPDLALFDVEKRDLSSAWQWEIWVRD